VLREKILKESISDYGALFGEILPPETLHAESRDRRRRHFPMAVTFWAWASQLLEGNGSCARALTRVQQWCAQAGLPIPEFDTSSYCRARQRLSEQFLDFVEKRITSHTEARRDNRHLWKGHRLKAIDGTSVQLMDTPANQQEYPQPSTQKPGCGFPVIGIVGVLDLSLGRVDNHVPAPCNRHDSKGLQELCGLFKPRDIVIADRGFCSFELIAKLRRNQVESVMRLHQRREAKLDWQQGEKLDADSRLVVWRKPQRPDNVAPAEWELLPEAMPVRLVRMQGRGRDGKGRTLYIVTTLLDAIAYPTEEIAALYAERWKIEVKFRDIKTTMGMERLEVRSPAMARKTLRMVIIVYNLLKALQLNAIRGEDILIDELGFKATLDAIAEFRCGFAGLIRNPRLLVIKRRELEERIAERLILIRPRRTEPRVVKTRPKPYPFLTSPRHQYVEILHRSHYRKAA